MADILIVDDDEAVSATLKIVLGAKGHNVVMTPDGKSGIEAVRARRFDLAIVDLFMPGINGLQVMKAIRAIVPGMPLVAASGFMMGGACLDMPGFEDMAKEAGAVATLYKPFRSEDVTRVVDLALYVSCNDADARKVG